MKRPLTLCVLSLVAASGCIRRQVTVTSDPPGALVYMNDQEIGRTPVTRDFTWYGRYEVAVRKDGYEPLKVHESIYAPFWQWVPLDFVTDALPVTDRHKVHYTLRPASTQPTATTELLSRAQNLQAKLESP